jgi:predicted N-acetyltransferase YhbS
MEIELRPEEEKDHRIVEALTREAFWNVYFPGCNEHLLIHTLRNAKEFVGELDFVATHGDEIVGHIAYAETKVIGTDTMHTVLTFGPISVLPKYQNQGIGSKLIGHTKKLSAQMGYKALLIYGDPDYYQRFGFAASKKYGITNGEGKFPAALLALELYPGALDGIRGAFDEGSAYAVNETELEEFEKGFPPKEKAATKTQERFNELAGKYL